MASLISEPGERPHRKHPVRVEEDVGALRRAIRDLAEGSGRINPAEAALMATELATNLIRHTTSGGYVLYRQTGSGIELLACDQGPGMRARRTTATASGGLGVGLQSVQRISTTFDVYSTSPGGTAILARLEADSGRPAWFRFGGVNVPFDRDPDSGDQWAVAGNGSVAALVVDGLGHGSSAAEASRAAIGAFDAKSAADLAGFMYQAHESMRGTRGGVAAVAAIHPERDILEFTGIGNIIGRLITAENSRTLMGRDGTLGTEMAMRRPEVVRHEWAPGAMLVLASDGLRARWNLSEYPGLSQRDPAIIAAVLQRDHGRASDDSTVLVLQDVRNAGGDGP